MTASTLIWLAVGLIGVGGFVGIIWSHLWHTRRGKYDRKGVADGHQGHSLLHAEGFDMSTGNAFGGSGRTWHAPKDPQQYAKAFVPRSKK